MNGIKSCSSDQSSMFLDHEDRSTSPTLTLIALPSGFSQVPSSTNLGLSDSESIADRVLFRSISALGIFGTAHVVSVQEDHGPLSNSKKGADVDNPLPSTMSPVVSGPKLVRTSVEPLTVIPRTETPCEPPKRSLLFSGKDQTESHSLLWTINFLSGTLLFSLNTESGTTSLTLPPCLVI